MRVLAGDIGGTHSRLVLATATHEGVQVHAEKTYLSQKHDHLLPIAEQFLHDEAGKDQPQAACFAVAGPVRGSFASVTNLPWQLQADELATSLGIKHVALINDFQAIGYGMDRLQAKDFFELQAGRPEQQGRRALIGAGTGLGESMLIWQEDHYRPWPTEGGHVNFAPRDDLEIELLRYLRSKHDHVSYEMLLSGGGLVRIYEFLRDVKHLPESVLLKEEMQEGDPAAAISAHALADTDVLAGAALDCFVRIYGAQAGNFALNCLATGGVYVAGGIAPKILARLTSGEFMTAFLDKGVMSDLMHTFPVNIILDEKTGLWGAVEYARRLCINS